MANNTETVIIIRALDKTQAAFKKIGDNLTRLGKQATIKLTTPLLALGGVMANTAMKFEASMNEVRAISGATGDTFKAMEDKARELGSTTKFSAAQAAQGFKFLSMAGWDAQQSISGLDGVLALAASTGMDLGSAADITSNIMSGLSISAGEAGRVADVLAKAASSANTNVYELGEASKWAAPMANAFGMSLEEMTAWLGKMADAGIKGSQAGNGLKTAITRMLDPSNEGADVLNRLGISIKNSDGSMRNFTEIMREFGLKGAEATDYIRLFGREAGPKMMAAANQGFAALDKLKGKLDSAGGTAKTMSEIMNSGLSGSITKLKSAFEGLSISMIKDTGLLGALERGITKINDFVTWLDSLSLAAKQTILWVGGIVAAIGPVLIILGTVAKVSAFVAGGINMVVKATIALRAALTALAANPIGLVIAGIGLAILGVVYYFDELKEAAGRVWHFLGNIFNVYLPNAIITAQIAFKNLKIVFLNIMNSIAKTFGDFVNAIIEGYNALPFVDQVDKVKFGFEAEVDEAIADIERLRQSYLQAQEYAGFVAPDEKPSSSALGINQSLTGGDDGGVPNANNLPKTGGEPVSEAASISLSQLSDTLKTKEQMEATSRQKELDGILLFNQQKTAIAEEMFANDLITQSERDQLVVEAEALKQQQLSDLARSGAMSRQLFEEMSTKNQVKAITGEAAKSLAVMATKSKKAFKIQKALAIADATVNGIKGVMKTMGEYPYPVNIGLAALSAAASAAQISNIKSQQFTPRQHGGPVKAGREYTVGENGREMFVPDQNGSIVPNDQLGGSQTNISMNINALDSQSLEDRLPEIKVAITDLVLEALEERG